MPAKIERCVAEVMKKQGLPESRAWAICTAAMKDGVCNIDRALEIGDILKTADQGLISDAKIAFKASIDQSTGFLTAPVNLARIGVQHYMGYELGLLDRALDKIGVMRPASEVFNPDSVNSFVNLVVTNDHPSEMVTTDNVRKLQVGSVSHVEPGSEVLSGVVTITDKKQIDRAKNGKVEVSVGYSHDLKEEKGNFNGVDYEFVQTNIRANHLAIVDAGRCGPGCKLTIDGKEKIVKITIDGMDFETEDKLLVQAIQKLQKSHDEEVEKLKKEKDQEEEEKEKMKKEKEKAEATADAIKSEKLTGDALNTLISDRAILIVDARAILGDKMPECTDCPLEIKTAVIDKILPDLKLDGKSKDYIEAAYDMAIEKVKKANGSLDNLTDDFKKKKETKVTRDSVRAKYMKDNLGMEG